MGIYQQKTKVLKGKSEDLKEKLLILACVQSILFETNLKIFLNVYYDLKYLRGMEVVLVHFDLLSAQGLWRFWSVPVPLGICWPSGSRKVNP